MGVRHSLKRQPDLRHTEAVAQPREQRIVDPLAGTRFDEPNSAFQVWLELAEVPKLSLKQTGMSARAGAGMAH